MIRTFIKEQIKIETPVDIDRVRRNGKVPVENSHLGRTTIQPRPIVVKVSRFQDRELIWRNTRVLLMNSFPKRLIIDDATTTSSETSEFST